MCCNLMAIHTITVVHDLHLNFMSIHTTGDIQVAVNDFVAVRVRTPKTSNHDEMHVAKENSFSCHVTFFLQVHQVHWLCLKLLDIIQVVDILPGRCVLSYMEKQRSSDHYAWPAGDNLYFTHPLCDIVCKLTESPHFIGSRIFSRINVNNANNIFHKEQ